MTTRKSPVPYFGAKGRTAPWITSLLPPHQHYVEPYCGGLSVLLAKQPAAMETVNDLDGELMTFWRVLRDRPAELVRACALTPHSRAELAAAHEPVDPGDDLELARRIWCRLAQGRAGTLRNTGWRHYIDPAGSGTSMPGYMAAYVDRLAAAAERLRRVSLESMPALDLIAKYGAHPDVLLYVDPPYLGTTRPWSNYRIEMKTEGEHRELAAALANCKAAVVLSGYDSPLYDELYAGWHRADHQTMTGNAKTAKDRTEVLWSNRVLAGRLSLFDDEPEEAE
ncbi:DNA adenine methylase [Streptomyces sp. SID5594]|uniref:DNA adenine methylase n=1 Tax=unclassified Streptomyces TaxID=2593676 RepID=UPI000380DC07|nr:MULTISPECIES: DNA adenine methylase [unclassified Streptomyces]MZF56911.1 DNA adenine methylase [Streptomyces sp. SID5594]